MKISVLTLIRNFVAVAALGITANAAAQSVAPFLSLFLPPIPVGQNGTLSVDIFNPDTSLPMTVQLGTTLPFPQVQALGGGGFSGAGCGNGSISLLSNSVSASITVLAGGTCTLSFIATGTVAGIYPILWDVTSPVSTSALDFLEIFEPPTAGVSFSPNPIVIGQTSQLSITLRNPVSSSGPLLLSGLINLGLLTPLDTVPGASPECGYVPPSGPFLDGGVGITPTSIVPGTNCVITLNVTAASPGNYPVPAIPTDLTGSIGLLPAQFVATKIAVVVPVVGATLVANLPPVLSVPTTPLVFPDTPVGGSSAPVTLVVTNEGGTPLAISSPVVPTGFGVTTDCPISPALLSPGPGCNLNVTFKPTALGTISGNLVLSSNGGPPATIPLSGIGVPVGPVVAKVFSPSAVQVGFPSTLSIALSNTNPVALTNVAFTDTFPAGLVVASTPQINSSCGGTVTAVAGGSSLALSGGAIPAGITAPGTCSVSVAVIGVAPSAGLTNTIPAGGVASTAGGPSNSASATLIVTALPPTFPGISLSTSSLGFASQTVNTTSSPQPIVVTSAGNAPLTISGISVSGDFAVSSPCTAASPLAPSSTCTIDVTFTPIVAAQLAGQVTITSNDPASPNSVVTLTGLGVAAPLPNVSLRPTQLNFPTTTAGRLSERLSATLTNTGGAPLSIRSINLVGTGFIVTDNCAASLEPGASCAVRAVFSPPSEGAYSATIRISTNAPGSPDFVQLAGNATAAAAGRLTASPPSLAFSDQIIDTASAPLAFSVANAGDAATSISGITVSGDFSLDGTCANLSPGESCAFRATFTPRALGTRSGNVVFAGDAANSPFAVGLTGLGVPVPAPRVTLSASSLGFGNSLVGAGRTLSVTVTNSGSADLVFGVIGVTGEFTITNGCAGNLAPGQSCRIDVQFVPGIPGERRGRLSIASNAEGSPHEVSLSGVGCRFAMIGRSLGFSCTP